MTRLLPLVLLFACSETGITAVEDNQDPVGEPEPEQNPIIQVEPPQLDFGLVHRGQSTPMRVTVTNIGDATLHLLDLLPPDATQVRVSPLDHSELEPQASTNLTVTWSPLSFQALDDAFHIEHSGGTATVAVPLYGTVPTPAITLDPEHHNFGVVDRGTWVDRTVTVGNAGDADLRIRDIDYASTSEAELFVHDLGALNSLPVSVAPGASTPITVRYQPADDVPDEGTLTVYSNDPTVAEAISVHEGVGTPREDYDITLVITADDEWEGWLNGDKLVTTHHDNWQSPDELDFTLPSGRHIVALHSWDKFRVVSGLIGYIEVDGSIAYLTGDDDFKLSATTPPSDWHDPAFDDSSWPIAPRCSAATASTWGTYWPKRYYDVGAAWIARSSDCRSFGDAWYRVVIDLP